MIWDDFVRRARRASVVHNKLATSDGGLSDVDDETDKTDATDPPKPPNLPVTPMTPKTPRTPRTPVSSSLGHARRHSDRSSSFGHIRRHSDRDGGRRRSSNADILESVGLPSTVSYQDMMTLQDGLCIDDILGHRPSWSARLKEAVSTVGGNAVHAARRASHSVHAAASTRCWTPRAATRPSTATATTPPPTAYSRKLQKKNPRPHSGCPSTALSVSVSGAGSHTASTRKSLQADAVLSCMPVQHANVIPPINNAVPIQHPTEWLDARTVCAT